MSAFGDCVVQCRAMLDRRFGKEPKVIHLRVFGALLLFLVGGFLLGGRANVQWAIGYAGACFAWVVAPSPTDLDRVYGARFVGTVRFFLVLGLLLAVATFLTFLTLFVSNPLSVRIVSSVIASGAWWGAIWLSWRAYRLAKA